MRSASKPTTVVSWSAACALAGLVLSGPVAISVVNVMAPQPPWSDVAAFAARFHWIQTLPYFAGLMLVGGLVALIAALHGIATEDVRPRTRLALALSSAFAAMIFLNYVVQTTFVPALLVKADHDALALAAHLTMVNPLSLGWALEMWGYGVLGVATWLAAPVFHGYRFGRTIAALFVANGPISVIGAFATAFLPGWVFTPLGFAAFGIWNVLVAAMLIGTIVAMRSAAIGTAPGLHA